MIIHLSDRTPIEINDDEWSVESNASGTIGEKIDAHMTVIKSSGRYVVYAGVYETVPHKVIFEGGYIVEMYITDTIKENYQKIIFEKLDSLAHQMLLRLEYCTEIEIILANLNKLLTTVRRGMPPEPL